MWIFVVILFTSVATALASELSARQNCREGYDMCMPKGSSLIPSDPNYFNTLYEDLINTINHSPKDGGKGSPPPVPAKGQANILRESPSPLCCASGMQCLVLGRSKLSFCWDRFTTNFYLPSGVYGSVTTGILHVENTTWNLLTGEFTDKSGSKRNFYDEAHLPKPNTATMSMPQPWTSKGVGSAIPGSELGDRATYTTTIPGTTRDPITIPASTIASTTVSGSVIPATTIPATTVPGTTVPPTTLTTTGPQKTGGADIGAVPRGALMGVTWCIVTFVLSLIL
ncbi:hypothetical protein FQN50_003528 [Emmonsiellopsis sp. PD_5]|nr:hypothetical protein FQN50_003528 [Emmonsiellopsis sp. PD_5]